MNIAKHPSAFDDDRPLQELLTWRIHVVHSKLNAQAARFLDEISGIPLAYWRIMLAIGPDGSTTHSSIRRMIMMDKGQLSRSLKGMIEADLVSSQDDDTDQRQQLLSLTRKGRQVFRKTLPRMRNRQDFLLDSLSKIERKAIYSALDKLELAAERRAFPA